MAETAAWLVDRSLREVPGFQWLLTPTFALRHRIAVDAELIAVVLAEVKRVDPSYLRCRARSEPRIIKPRCGAVTVVQRFGDRPDLIFRFRSISLDGMYEGRVASIPRIFLHALRPCAPASRGGGYVPLWLCLHVIAALTSRSSRSISLPSAG